MSVDFFRFMATDASKQQYVNAFVAADGTTAAGEGEWTFIRDRQAYSPGRPEAVGFEGLSVCAPRRTANTRCPDR